MVRLSLFVTYTIIQSITSSEMCSLHLTHPSAHPAGAVSSRCCGARGAVGVRCLAQESHLSRGLFLLEPRFKPTTSGYKSNALSTRPRLYRLGHDYEGFFTSTVNWSKLKSKTVKRKGSINCRTDLAHYALISLSFVLWTSLCGLQSAAPARCDSVLLQAHHSAHGMCISA